MAIDYVHSQNRHSLAGPEAAFPRVMAYLPTKVTSLVDVGCGTGTWLRAALNNGIEDVIGLDGVIAPISQLVVDPKLIHSRELTLPLDVGRRFSVALCLEVGEHLDESNAARLITSLVNLADVIVFSAACPGQSGQHHVNCQWPEYWQSLFNKHEYACDDRIRWDIWELSEVEPWYRQNMFIARHSPTEAGREARLRPVLHPEMAIHGIMLSEHRGKQVRDIEAGSMPLSWYLITPARALAAKGWRLLRRKCCDRS